MITHKFIDYIAYNIDEKSVPFYSFKESIPPITNYKWGRKNYNGTRVYGGHNKTDKFKVIMSGLPLSILRTDFTDIETIENILSKGGNITRLDMAMDMYVVSDLITPDEFMKYYHDGLVVSSHIGTEENPYKPSVYSVLSGDEIQHQTLNFGDRKKRGRKGMVRVYDKGVELELGQYMITRLEVEDKQGKAQSSAKRIVECGDIGSVIKSRFDVNDDRFQSAIDAPSIDITRGSGRGKIENDDNNSRWKWLVETVAKSLGKAIALDENMGRGSANKELFIDAMYKGYDEFKVESLDKI